MERNGMEMHTNTIWVLSQTVVDQSVKHLGMLKNMDVIFRTLCGTNY